jgi:ABC-2 type transport system permease protein/lipopolysaccharide transport system permease protein
MEVRTTPQVPASEAKLFPPPQSSRGPSRWLALIRRDHDELIRFWPVVQNMVVQELRVRYQRSFLGFVWTLLHPILMMTTLTLVFSHLFKQERYAVYLLAGMVPWGFLNGSLNECAFCIIQNENLIRKIYLPKLVFPLSKVLINLITFLLSMTALFLILQPLGARLSLSMVCLPIALALFFAFTLGLSLIVATANTFYRDCGHLVSVFLQAWYFATPIVYPLEHFPAELRWRFWLNPAYPFIDIFQVIIKDGRWPEMTTFLIAAGFAAMSLGIGYAAFKSHEDKLVFRL